jgi:hypothetical protein
MSNGSTRVPAETITGAFTWANLFGWPSGPDPALLAAREEIENLRAALAARDADAALTERLLREARWASWPGIAWPPQWLIKIVQDGRADAVQSDRALVAAPSRNVFGDMTAPIPMPRSARWFRHTEPPRGFDADAYASARRVLALCDGRDNPRAPTPPVSVPVPRSAFDAGWCAAWEPPPDATGARTPRDE